MRQIRVVLAEDHALLREGLSKLIDGQPDLHLVGTAGDLPGLLELIARKAPHVVVTDIRMPPTSTDEGIQAAAFVRTQHPEMGVVVLSQYANPSYALALLAEGSAGRAYLLKERVTGVDDLLRAIREVAAGRSVIDPAVVEALVSANIRRPMSDLERAALALNNRVDVARFDAASTFPLPGVPVKQKVTAVLAFGPPVHSRRSVRPRGSASDRTGPLCNTNSIPTHLPSTHGELSPRILNPSTTSFT